MYQDFQAGKLVECIQSLACLIKADEPAQGHGPDHSTYSVLSLLIETFLSGFETQKRCGL